MSLDYGQQPKIRRPTIAAVISVIGCIFLIVCARVTDRRAYVNYSRGELKNSITIAGVPIWKSVQPIFEQPRQRPTGNGKWEIIMTVRNLMGHKYETPQTEELASLKITIELIALIDDHDQRFQKRELMDRAWKAAESHDMKGLKDIQTEVDAK
jgi:hypothetical protein